jgi:LmbE family N-acetylglucosaminyl deacetylase
MLIAFAHPDDESFGMGGAIARYAQSGAQVALICSTNGDVGTVDPEHLQGFASVADLRLNELRCAASTLGIDDVITFGYRDSGMMGTPENNHPDCLWQADENVVVGRIVKEMRRLRPQVVVTFDPYGGYGHPDHIFMHRATTKAFHAAGDPAQYPEHLAEGWQPYRPAKLYYNTFPRAWLLMRVWMVRLQGQDPRHLGKNKDLDLQEVLDQQLPGHARINIGPYHQAWDDASGCHASQGNPRPNRSLLDRVMRLLFRHQYFTRAWPEPRPRERMEHDLFEGIALNSGG